MAGPEPRARRRGRLRLAAGFSVVLGGIALLLWPRATQPTEVSGRGRPGTPPSPEALGDGFEPQDADARRLVVVMAVAAVVIAVSIAGLFGLLAIFHARDAVAPPLTSQQRAVLVPPGPPLQAAPLVDIATLRSREQAELDGYQWVNPDHTAARIPIGRAMALVAGKPLDPAP